MPGRILQDVYEFMAILRGVWRKDLKELLEHGELQLPRPEGGSVVVSVPRIHIPRLRFIPPPMNADLPNDKGDASDDIGGADPGDRGVGRGKGKPGTVIGRPKKDGQGNEEGEGEEGKGAGKGRGGDSIKIEISPEELLQLLREILELPWLKPKGSRKIKTEEWKYTDIRKQGPRSLLHKRRTMREAMKRALAGDSATDPARVDVTPIRDDMRYRIPQLIIKPKTNAVVFYLMDVSGSMGMEERKIVRYFCSLCSFLLSSEYDGLVEEWIIHDGEADRVTREEFFETYRGGGTVISTAHELAVKIIDEEYSPAEWNIYFCYLSDGFNYVEDDAHCQRIISERILPMIKGADRGGQYSYCEIALERYWYQNRASNAGTSFEPPGSFGKMIAQAFSGESQVSWSVLKKIENVLEAIKKVFREKKKEVDDGK